MPSTSEQSSTVALGVSKCPFASNIRNTGVGGSIQIVSVDTSRIFHNSVSEMALVRAFVSMKPSVVNILEFHRKI